MRQAPNPSVYLILAVAAVLVGGGANYWQYTRKQQKIESIEKIRKSLRNEKEVREELDELAKQLADSSAKLNHLEQSVPELAYVPTLLSELEQVGNTNGIEVLGVRPIPTRPDPTGSRDKERDTKKKIYEELDIEVKGRGTYMSVMRFISALRNFPKIVAVRTTSLTPKVDPNQKGSPRLDATVEIRAYLFPPADPGAGWPLPGKGSTEPSPNPTGQAPVQPTERGTTPAPSSPKGNDPSPLTAPGSMPRGIRGAGGI